jgi:ubiquitin C-terminal hydrolase
MIILVQVMSIISSGVCDPYVLRSSREKLNTQVEFPLKGLDLSRYLLQTQGLPPIYDCFAVSNHYGGMGGGHYTAYCKLPSEDK